MKRGFSTIELMIAMAIMIIVLTGVVSVAFGNQTFLAGSQTNAEAMIKAQTALEGMQALGRKDFNLVNATSTNEGFFTTNIQVTNAAGVSPHPFDYLTKAVSVIVSWKDEYNVMRNLTLRTLVTNFTDVNGTNTCNSSPQGNWVAPAVHSDNLLSLVPGLSGTYPVLALDAYQDRLYIAAGPTAAGSDKTFFIFNLASGIPSYISGSGMDTSGNASTKGPSGIVVASNTTLWAGKTYAFIANGVSPADWGSPGSCGVASASCSQLEVVDVSNPSSPSVSAYFKFATSTYSIPNYPPYVSGTTGKAVAKSIFYKNGYVFLGLTKTGSGPEFNIIDVHNPLAPQPVGSFTVGAGVDSIRIRGNFAYLATDDKTTGNSLTILDISDPTTPKRVWAPLMTSSFGYGQSVAMVGDKLYFGITYNSSNPEVFVFNNPKPSTAAPVQQASTINLGGTLGISDMLVRDYLLFLLTSTNSLQIRNATSLLQYAPSIVLSGNGSVLDCEGNYLYIGSSDASGSIKEITGS